jgi:hypothetical protein
LASHEWKNIGLTKTPIPLFFMSVDYEGAESICFDKVLQVLILRELQPQDLSREIRPV